MLFLWLVPIRSCMQLLTYRAVIITQVDGSRRGLVWTGVCLFVHTISQKLMQLGSPNLTYKCSTMSPGNALIFGVTRSKAKVASHKKYRRGSLHFYDCWIILFIGVLVTGRSSDVTCRLKFAGELQLPAAAGRQSGSQSEIESYILLSRISFHILAYVADALSPTARAPHAASIAAVAILSWRR